MSVRLRTMTDSEVEDWRAADLEAYIAARIASGEPEDRARRVASRQSAEYFPGGRPAPGHRLMIVEDDGRRVGLIWAGPDPKRADDPGVAWIYNLRIDEERRGHGFGGRALALMESDLVRNGVTELGLDVFGDNATARRLYARSGYREVTVRMSKTLAPDVGVES